MDNHRGLKVLEAARQVADEVNRLIDNGSLIHVYQLRKSSQSVPANIKEGFTHRTIPKRNQSLGVSRSEAEETIEHLRPNYVENRIDRKTFFRLKNRLITIVKMLDSLIES
jgi:four helix bundle protein